MIFKYAVIPLIEQYYCGKGKAVKAIMDICNQSLDISPLNLHNK